MTDAPPFSRLVRIDALPADGLSQTIEASQDERAALAALNRLPAIASLTASFTVRRSGAAGCGRPARSTPKSLSFASSPSNRLRRRSTNRSTCVLRRRRRSRRGHERRRRGDGRDRRRGSADPIVDGKIDLGALAAEFFALGLDPYPRKPGVAFEPHEDARGGEQSPFAALAQPKKQP